MGETSRAATVTRISGFRHEAEAGNHGLLVDEPTEKGGGDAGPSPQALLAAALASCTAVTMEMYADRKGWDLDGLSVAVDTEGEISKGTKRFEVIIELPGTLDEEQRDRLLKIAARCPVHRALTTEQPVEIRTGSTGT